MTARVPGYGAQGSKLDGSGRPQFLSESSVSTLERERYAGEKRFPGTWAWIGELIFLLSCNGVERCNGGEEEGEDKVSGSLPGSGAMASQRGGAFGNQREHQVMPMVLGFWDVRLMPLHRVMRPGE